jgi:hypothetical protein
MSAHPPPVPPDQQTRNGKGSPEARSEKRPNEYDSRHRNLAEQGRQGNIKQNTTNKGLQQDR